MVGIRFEGVPPRPTGTRPPGVDEQLTQSFGPDAFGGMNLAQLNAVSQGGVQYRNVSAWMNDQYTANQSAVRSSMQNTSMPGVVLGMQPRATVSPMAGLGSPDALQFLRSIDATEKQILNVGQASYNFQRGILGIPGFGAAPGFGAVGGGLPPFPPAGVGMPAPGRGGGGGGFPPGGGGSPPGGGGGGFPPGGGPGGPGPGGPGPGGGGPGGGGPGPGGRGGGWPGGRMPFLPGVGFPNIARLGGLPGLAAGILEEVAFSPQIIAGAEQSALGNARPYTDYIQSSYAFARAAGGDAQRSINTLSSGNMEALPWMRALGIGPTSATRLEERFGIVQQSEVDRTSLVSSLAAMPLMGAFSRIGPQAQAAARQAALMGAVPGTGAGVDQFSAQVAPVLETAIVRGMDRVEVLKSIDASMQIAARAGALNVASPGDIGNFLMRFSNLAGGMTGQAGVRAIAGIQGAMETTMGQSPVRTAMMVTAAMSIHNEQDLARMLGQQQYAVKLATPEGRAQIQNFMQARRAGNTYFMDAYLNALMQGNTEAQARVLTQKQFFYGIPDYGLDAITGRALNIDTNAATAMRVNPQGVRPEGTQADQIKSPELRYDSSKTNDFYKDALRRMNVPEQFIDTIVNQSAMAGINPIWAGAVMMHESGGRVTSGNVMQITPANAPRDPVTGRRVAPPMNPFTSIQQGILQLRDAARRGNLHDASQAYNGPAMDQVNPGYVADVQRRMTVGYGRNVPEELLRTQADVEQAGVTGAMFTFNELQKTIAVVNPALDGLAHAAERATTWLNRLSRSGGSSNMELWAHPVGPLQ